MIERKLLLANSNWNFYLDYLFQGIPLSGKSMLDIGCGNGTTSFYAASKGANKIVCLEPEMDGSTEGSLNKFRKMSSIFSTDISLKTVAFQDFNATNEKFDILLLHNSINHLNEEACINLRFNNTAQKEYGIIFRKLSQLTSSGGVLIIADCMRDNFFASFNLKSPFQPTIEWVKHQNPEFWELLLSQYGFKKRQLRWTSFSFLRTAGQRLFSNKYAAYFLSSHFVLVLEKIGD